MARWGVPFAASAAAVAIGATLGASPAQAANCKPVEAGGKIAWRIEPHNIDCASARGRLQHWMRTGFPHTEFRWSCDLRGRQKTCSKGLGPDPLTITFYLRRA
jgi:hypothetical protein